MGRPREAGGNLGPLQCWHGGDGVMAILGLRPLRTSAVLELPPHNVLKCNSQNRLSEVWVGTAAPARSHL